LKHALERLDILVTRNLPPENLRDAFFNPETFSPVSLQLFSEVQEEIGKIRSYLLHKDLHTHEKEVMEQLIHRYQAGILYLLDTIFAYNQEDLSLPFHQFYEKMTEELEVLMKLLQHRYAVYFNREEKIPQIELIRQKEQFRTTLNYIKKSDCKIVADDRLLSIILVPFELFDKTITNTRVTYRELNYLQQLVKHLSTVHPDLTKTLPDRILIELLIIHNFNSAAFIDYLAGLLADEAEEIKENHRKSIFYTQELNKILQLKINPGKALLPEMASVKDELIRWLKGEIYFLDKQRPDLLPGKQQIQEDTNEAGKIDTAFSTPEIALLVLALRDTKMMQFEDKKGLFKGIAMNFTSIGTKYKSMSWVSLNAKFSSVENTTVQSLIKKLRQLNDYLRGLEPGFK
jgi:hypothetical protein